MNGFFMNVGRGIKGAFKSIKSNFKEYICFFLALIMVQVLFGTVTVAFRNNRKVEKKLIDDAGYTYHAILTGATVQELNILRMAAQAGDDQDARYFTYDDARNDGRVTLTFTKNVKESRTLFEATVLRQMNGGSERVGLIVTPLYDYDISSGADAPIFIVILLLLMGLSFLLLMALFRIRINHFKFTYSIYMAFGGDFKKLLGSAFYEMLLIALFSYPVSLILTYAICALLYLPFGMPFGFYFPVLPVVLVCSLICSILALIFPMRVLASGMPVKHMKAQDNSNMVSSPRRSKVILRSKPLKIELLSLWRYRKHLAILMLSTVTFAALGVAGSYLADIYAVRTDVEGSDLSLTFADSGTAEAFFGYFAQQAEKEGVAHYTLEKRARDPFDEAGENAGVQPPHLAIPTSKTVSAEFMKHPLKGDVSVSAALDIRAFDEYAFTCFSDVFGYTWRGEPQKLFTDPDALIVSSSLANREGNTLSPGDRVYMSVGSLPLVSTDADDLRTDEQELKDTVFIYKEFTVAAVIDNYADYDRMLVYLPTVPGAEGISAYEEVMGQKPDYTNVNVYLSDKSDVDTAARIVQEFVSYPKYVGKAAFKLDFGDLERRISAGKNYRGLIVVLSVLVFAVSPIAGFFSQILFYGKRKTEFDMIRAVGGVSKTLRTVFAADAAVFAVLSGALYTALSFLAVRVICAAMNTPFIFALFGKATHASSFSPDMPVVPFVAGLILTLLFAAAEVWLSGLIYKRQSGDHLAESFTADEERR